LDEAEEIIIIEPLPPGSYPWQAYFVATQEDSDEDRIVGGTVLYDPNRGFYVSFGGKQLFYSPDVVLAHELGHALGFDDPPVEDRSRLPGDCVEKVENPYRKEKGLPERPWYSHDMGSEKLVSSSPSRPPKQPNRPRRSGRKK